ncbi:MAG: glycosyltransferase [Candidatus Omnitrophota bacterium]
MRIGIDAREFKKGHYTGLRTILHTFLINAVLPPEDEFIFFCDQHTDTDILSGMGSVKIVEEKNTFVWDQYRLPRALKSNKIDIFFSPYIKTPLRRVCPYVNTICDIIPLTVPKYGGLMSVFEKIHFYLYSFAAGRRALKVITLSNDAKNKVSGAFGIEKEKIEVVYPAVGSAAPFTGGGNSAVLKEKYSLDDPYILYAGNFKRHKNIERLIDSFNMLPDPVKNVYRLFLVGGGSDECEKIEKAIEAKGLTGKVIPVLNVKHEEIFTFLKSASAFVFPSLAEGFGIPPLEAMANGIPVAASGIAPMTEVLGDAAVYFDPYSPMDMAEATRRILSERELREKCVEKGLKRAAGFTPENMAAKLLNILRDAGREKTLCISSEYPPVAGGISTHIYNLWKRLPEDEIIILTVKNKTPFSDGRRNVIRRSYPSGGGRAARFFRTLLLVVHVFRVSNSRNIRKNHCAQVLSSGLAGLVMKKLKRVPYIVYVYSADILEFSKDPVTGYMLRVILSGSERIIANSNFTKTVVTGRALAAPDKVIVSTPGVDSGIFNPAKGDGGIRKKLGIKDDEKMILSVSRLAERKGHDNVIKALSGIVKDYPGFVYVIAGDGPKKKELEALAGRENLQDRVIFAGEIGYGDLVNYYNACDVFILVPRYIPEAGDVEGFGIVFLEAGACGKPVIAGNSGGVPEAVADGVSGILVEPEDVPRIEEALLRFLRDEDYARETGENGRRRANSEFAWDTRAEALRQYL